MRAASITRGNIVRLASRSDGLRVTVPRGKWPTSSIDGYASTHDCPRRNSHLFLKCASSVNSFSHGFVGFLGFTVNPMQSASRVNDRITRHNQLRKIADFFIRWHFHANLLEHFGLWILNFLVPWIVSPHFGQTCGTGERGGLVCAARRIWDALVVFIVPPVQHVQWDALVCWGAMWSPMQRTDRNRSARIRSFYQWMRIVIYRSIRNPVSHKSMDDKVQPQLSSFFLPQFQIYTHCAMCQGGY